MQIHVCIIKSNNSIHFSCQSNVLKIFKSITIKSNYDSYIMVKKKNLAEQNNVNN